MKTLSILFIAMLVLNPPATYGNIVPGSAVSISISDIPDRTVIIKHPAAADINQYFSSATVVTFEIYKAGSNEAYAKIISSIKSNKAVESCTEGPLTGDYRAVSITLTAAQNKAWFVTLFRNAGLNTIKVNNNPIVEVDKL